MRKGNRCLHKQFIAEKYDIQCTPTKLVLYNWMNPEEIHVNHLRDFDMTKLELNKSKKLNGRKYRTKRFEKHNAYRNTTQNHSYANGIMCKKIPQPTNFKNDRLIVIKTSSKQNSMKKTNCLGSYLTKHNRHDRCFESPFKMPKKNNYVKAANYANQTCLSQRYAIQKNELQTVWKQQFNEFILPVLIKYNTKLKKLMDNTKTTIGQTTESFNQIPDSKQSLNIQLEKINEEFQLEESHPFYMDYLNPSCEWFTSSRPYSAPPVFISTTYK
ncbi:hypothetical protein KSF78_0001451 [Schistosoma japonicum]|nr:hypothetical protein KSF78_0001451 [Schistosoma japonicum]